MGGVDRDRAAAITDALEERLVDGIDVDPPVDRRSVLGGLSIAGAAGMAGLASAHEDHDDEDAHEHGNFGARGGYEDDRFDPHEFLRTFYTGEEGAEWTDVYEETVYGERRTVREFEISAVDTTIEIAPGVDFEAWAFNNQVPAPTLRAEEGDLIRIEFTNGSKHAHTIHPHLENYVPEMDGVPQNGPGVLDEGDSYRYEWIARPMGVHFYHCHSLPLKEHMHRGLYGMIVVDPDPDRVRENPREYVNYHGPIDDDYVEQLVDRARSRNFQYTDYEDEGEYVEYDEMVMVMNSFDTNFDGENEVYAANTRAFAYAVGSTDGEGNWEAAETRHPIQIERDTPVRIYLLNTTEFDPLNSFHSHSQFFDYYDHGTTLFPTHKRVDTIHQVQAQRGIVELDYSDHEPGLYMFHAHQSEFSELGWMSFFEVTD